jgi:hypothetical protein
VYRSCSASPSLVRCNVLGVIQKSGVRRWPPLPPESSAACFPPIASSSSTTTSTDASGERDEPDDGTPDTSATKKPPLTTGAPLAAGAARRLALNDRAEQRLMARLLARGGTPRVAAYVSQRATAFGSGPVQLTEDESSLVLREQEQFWALPGSTRSDTGGVVVVVFFFVDGTRPFPSVSDECRLRCLFLLVCRIS